MNPSENNLVKSDAVMAFFGYSHRSAFWHFIKTKGVPHLVLNARRVMFDPVALNNWLARRDTSGTPRKFVFSPPEAQAATSAAIPAAAGVEASQAIPSA